MHTLNPATWLSCVRPDTAAKGASLATTLDQVIAQQLGQQTALPSLELASETTVQIAAGNGGFYSVTTSYAAPNKPLPMEYNPRKVFIQLMGEGDTAAERDALLRKNAQHPRHDRRAHQTRCATISAPATSVRCPTTSTPFARSSAA